MSKNRQLDADKGFTDIQAIEYRATLYFNSATLMLIWWLIFDFWCKKWDWLFIYDADAGHGLRGQRTSLPILYMAVKYTSMYAILFPFS